MRHLAGYYATERAEESERERERERERGGVIGSFKLNAKTTWLKDGKISARSRRSED